MGLDVYVGSLTRYYSRQWETVVQQVARESNLQLTIVRQDDSPPPEPSEIEPVAASWRDGLSQALSAHGIPPLTWVESMETPYFTDKPAWDCYSALMVWVAHLEHPDAPLPAVAPKDWTDYKPFIASQERGNTRFPHLLRDTEFWIPTAIPFTFNTPDISGSEVGIGSVHSLKEELELLNRESWRAPAGSITEWRRGGADFGAPLELSARFAFAVFFELSGAAVKHCLPMKLDY